MDGEQHLRFGGVEIATGSTTELAHEANDALANQERHAPRFMHTGAQFDGWCRGAGFTRTEIVPLARAASAVVAYK